MMTFNIHSTRRVYSGFMKIDEVDASFSSFEGETLTKTFEILEKGEAVAILVEDTENEAFLMVKQFRIPTVKHQLGWILEIPAGMMDANEQPMESAKRELMEEMGYQVNDITYLFPFYATPGASTERVHLFHAKVKSTDKIQKGGGVENEIEDIEIVPIKIDQILSKIGTEIVDGKTIIGIYQYFIKQH